MDGLLRRHSIIGAVNEEEAEEPRSLSPALEGLLTAGSIVPSAGSHDSFRAATSCPQEALPSFSANMAALERALASVSQEDAELSDAEGRISDAEESSNHHKSDIFPGDNNNTTRGDETSSTGAPQPGRDRPRSAINSPDFPGTAGGFGFSREGYAQPATIWSADASPDSDARSFSVASQVNCPLLDGVPFDRKSCLCCQWNLTQTDCQ